MDKGDIHDKLALQVLNLQEAYAVLEETVDRLTDFENYIPENKCGETIMLADELQHIGHLSRVIDKLATPVVKGLEELACQLQDEYKAERDAKQGGAA